MVRAIGLVGAAAVALLAWGCGAGGDNPFGGGSGGTTTPTGTGTPTGTAGEGGLGLDVDSGPPCETHCSADLHRIIDCNGMVVLECPDDQGCGPDGTCIDACDAAAANASTFGCDFYSVTPAVIAESRGSCFAAMIANTWTSPITITADYAGTPIDTATHTYIPQGQGASLTYQPMTGGQLGPGELGILFLSKYESGDIFQVDCPVPQGLEMSTQVDASGRGNAFHITTDRPIVAYDVYPWGGAASYVSSATLLVPTPTWADNFVSADAWEPLHGNPFTQIVAAEDGTTVTMVATNNVVGGNGAPSFAANTPTDFTLDRGEVVQFLQGARLAGSTLSADKPISVWGGSSCMNIPNNVTACDAAHQQLLPVQTLGNEYAVVRYPNRSAVDSAPLTMVGMVDGTTLTYDPMPAGAPPALNRGDLVVFYAEQPFHVVSQDEDHPFYVAAHMTGGNPHGGVGDPEYVNLVPPQQYLDFYLFATDPTYGNTALVFVRQRDENGSYQDVTLDCLGPVTGWLPLGATDYEYAQVMLVQGGVGVGSCNNGAHTAASDVPFGLTVWGYDQYASYAYPAGMSVEPINTVVVPPTPR